MISEKKSKMLKVKAKAGCKWDLMSLGEVMLRLHVWAGWQVRLPPAVLVGTCSQ